ncbi:MAG: DUF1549 and DUF1553 domain-containing protein [Pirellulaceae bacterium]
MNDVVPVLTRAGCNIGVCHAKAVNGQNGFLLSLLGFEPQEDYDHLVREARGRRVSPSAPDSSLLLMKATARMPHGGGKRLDEDSEAYRILRTWIAQGMPNHTESDPQLVSFAVEPARGVVKPHETQQLKAVARYSDGTVRDVTQLALFESNDKGMAEASAQGLVRVLDVPGNVSVMVRYQGKIAVYAALVPLGAPLGELPAEHNFVDRYVFESLRQIGMPPSPACDDATFLRRVSLDIAGRLPSVEEAEAFLANSAPDKRDQLIEELLRSPDYADYFANKWTALLKNRRDAASDITSNFAFHSWVRDSLLENKPYDQIVRELLAATGSVVANPPVAWYKRVKQLNDQIEDVAQLFLGVRMQCAQCHHHPFERWSQDDYYGLAAFFSQIGRRPTEVNGEDFIFHKRGVAGAKNVRTGEIVKPSALGDGIDPIPPDQDPRLVLADWLRREDNPFFAKALVNRYWKHFFKRGLIEPEDDIRDTNPATNPELLAALERHFIKSGFDLKELVRVLTRSQAYQLSAATNEHNVVDQQNYSRYYPKRLQAEVLLDAIDKLAGSRTDFANLPAGTRAIALPDNSYNRASLFLKVFGRPDSASVCECERIQSSSLAQSLHLLNSGDIKSKLGTANGRADQLAKNGRPDADNVRELYLAAYSRAPQPEELVTAVAYLGEPLLDTAGKPVEAGRARREKYEDLLWALMNTKEFLFNH